MAASKKTSSASSATKSQVVKYLTALLDEEMSLGDRAAITRTIQKLKGER